MSVQREFVDVGNIEARDLDALTTEDLLRERSVVKIAIAEIDAQLKDAIRRPSPPEDNSPEWEEYRDWRRRARWALVYRRKDLEQIKQLLRERHDTSTAGRRLHLLQVAPEVLAAEAEAQAARKTRLLTALREQTSDLLLLKAYRVIHHLLDDGADLPDSLDAQDRDVLGQVAIHLREQFGRENVKHAVAGDLMLEAATS